MFSELKNTPANFIPFRFPNVEGQVLKVCCAFQMAGFGNMSLTNCEDSQKQEVAQRRKSLPTLFNFDSWVELKQVHGDKMLVNPSSTAFDADSTLEADASSTSELGLALCIKTADCQPILLADKSGSAIAALHVGWRGNAIEFIQSAVKEFTKSFGIKAQNVMAVRGPSLGPAQAEFTDFSNEWDKQFMPWYNTETKCMDLWALTHNQLMDAGIHTRNIYALDLCTRLLAASGAFFSYRAGDAGRQVSLIWLEK